MRKTFRELPIIAGGELNFVRFDGADPTMADIQKEIKGFGGNVTELKTSMEKDLKALRDLLDTKTSKDNLDPLIKTQVEAMAASVATKHSEIEKTVKSIREQADAIETAMKRAPAGANATTDEAKALERAVQFAMVRGSVMGNLNFKNLPTAETIGKEGLEAYQAWEEKQFGVYLRMDERAVEAKALQVGVNPDGGYLVPTARSAQIVKKVYETSPLRQLANIETIGTSELEIPIDTDEAGAGWVGETEARPTTNTPQVGVQKIPVHEMYAKPKATQKILEDAAVNIEAWLADKIAEKFTRLENTAFMVGNGINKPRGILSYTFTTDPALVARGTPLSIASGGATSVTADALVKMPFMLKSAYLAGASWLMKRSAVMAAMLLKDGQGQYLWRPAFNVGGVSSLGGYEVHMADDMPAIGAGTNAIAFGNWKRAYTIVDRLGITTLRDPYSAKPFVEFYTRKRVGGDVVDFEAYVVMNVAAG